jgi:VWFA-related protein
VAIRLSRARATLVVTVVLTVPAVAGVAPQQQPTFRAGVEIVAIDVNVVDARARPIEGLKPEDFTVTVDRKPRTIVSAQYINHGVRLVQGRGGSGSTGAGVLDDLAAPPPALIGRNVMVVIDTDSLDTASGMNAVRAARRFLDELPSADRVGVATIPRLPSSLTFVADRSEARKALDKVITAPAEIPMSEYTVGLQEAFDVDRNDNTTIAAIVARECKCIYANAGDAAAVSARDARTAAADTSASGLLSVCTGDQTTQCVVPLLMYAHQVAIAGHMHAQRSLDALRDLADGLRQIPGPKTVVFVSGGLGIPETPTSFDPLEPALANGQMTLYTLYIERMSLGQVARPLSPSFAFDDRIDSIGLENVTAAAGGTLVRVVSQVESAFDRVVTEMSGSYLLGIEVEPGDRDGKPHAVDVKVNRRGVEVRARRRYVIEPEKPGVKRADAPPPVSAAARAARRAARSAPIVPELESVTPELVALLVRAGDFAVDYQQRIEGLLSEEQYDQTLSKWKSGPVVVAGTSQTKDDWFVDKRRRMRSDYLLARGGGPIGWQQFRDPFEVDGAAIRPHTGRLAKLFADTPPTALQQASQYMTESARYNLGFGERNMDVPTLALVLLEPATRDRFFFRKQGEQRINGTTVWQVAYTERGSPTIFAGDHRSDLPLEGTLWIEPQQGRVVRSTLRLNMEETDAEITVSYAPTADLGGLWVPTEVRETYTSDTQKLESMARYVNFRVVKTK